MNLDSSGNDLIFSDEENDMEGHSTKISLKKMIISTELEEKTNLL